MAEQRAQETSLLLCADAGYLRPLAVALHTALRNVPTGVVAYVVRDGFSSLDAERLERVAARVCGAEVRWLESNRVDLSGLRGARHLTVASYLRLFAGELPIRSDRVLFLDADVLVRQPLEPLLTRDLRGRTIGAVRDMVIADGAHPYSGAPSRRSKPYFNAGVLLIDLSRWRALEYGSRAVSLARANPGLVNADQDILNELLADDWVELDPTWNVQGALLLTHLHPPHPWVDVIRRHRQLFLRDPAIVHFSGIKPWRPSSSHPYAAEWRSALRSSRLSGQGRWRLQLLAKRKILDALVALGSRERPESLK